ALDAFLDDPSDLCWGEPLGPRPQRGRPAFGEQDRLLTEPCVGGLGPLSGEDAFELFGELRSEPTSHTEEQFHAARSVSQGIACDAGGIVYRVQTASERFGEAGDIHLLEGFPGRTERVDQDLSRVLV